MIGVAILGITPEQGGLGVASIIVITLATAIAYAIPNERSGCRWYNGLMPAHALEAYQTAKRSKLFDLIEVYSPREDDFRTEPVRLRTDPLLIGTIESPSTVSDVPSSKYHFLLAYWNLAEDIEFVESQTSGRTSGIRTGITERL